jgi:hypothetical protein
MTSRATPPFLKIKIKYNLFLNYILKKYFKNGMDRFFFNEGTSHPRGYSSLSRGYGVIRP